MFIVITNSCDGCVPVNSDHKLYSDAIHRKVCFHYLVVTAGHLL